jgi:SagB-type dehydrogenase family enzyme
VNFSEAAFYQYHTRTKHTVQGLMNSNRSLDWSNQPDPFRVYAGAPRIQLPTAVPPPRNKTLGDVQAALLRGIGVPITSQGTQPDAAILDTAFLSGLLFHSMALSAWKQIRGTDHKWALRVNPSSGNLHPTETHLLIKDCAGIKSGAYHYSVADHTLELRCDRDHLMENVWSTFDPTASEQPQLVVLFSSIFWREAWKYESRAFRYCQHDLGHALAAITLAAASYGWHGRIIGQFPDDELASLMGLNGTDERPMLLLGLRKEPWSANEQSESGANSAPKDMDPKNAAAEFIGKPNRLSATQTVYPLIDRVYESTLLDRESWIQRISRHKLPDTTLPNWISGIAAFDLPGNLITGSDFGQVVRTRRSAVDMDSRQRMSKQHFGDLLYSATRGFAADFQRPTFDQHTGHHLIHLFLYVHRVDDIEPGLYYYDQLACRLIQLKPGDARTIAKFCSCFQDIAADGCFALSMVADFQRAFELYKNRCYRFVHHEAGYIGQHLYLTAEALDYESTGIGCFVDDEVNQLFELPAGYEVVYNFTIGRAVLDPRLTSLPAYDFIVERISR